MNFPSYFPELEFQRASDRPLTPEARANALLLANVLQPLRDAMGFPIYVTSFYSQSGHSISSVHKKGEAVDVSVDHNDRAKLQKMYAWLKANPRTPAGSYRYGKVIDERNHLHITIPGSQRAFGQAWLEPVEGEYVLEHLGMIATVATSPLALTWLLLMIGGYALYKLV